MQAKGSSKSCRSWIICQEVSVRPSRRPRNCRLHQPAQNMHSAACIALIVAQDRLPSFSAFTTILRAYQHASAPKNAQKLGEH